MFRISRLALFVATTACLCFVENSAISTPLNWQPLNEPGAGGRIDSIVVSPHDASRLLVGGDILSTHLSTNQGQSWLPTTGWLSYEIADFTWHPQEPDRVWAGTLSGPHLSIDGGKTWTAKRTGLPPIEADRYSAPVEKILFDPDSQNLLALGGDHRQLKAETAVENYGTVWLSENGGDRWTRLSEIVAGGNIMAASYAGSSENQIYAAVWNHGFFRSRDDGKTWEAANNGLPEDDNGNLLIASLAVHPTQAQTAWITVENFGIYKTTDGGESWRSLQNGIPAKNTSFWAIAVGADGQTLYAGNRNFEYKPGVYKSLDGGESWQKQFCSAGQIDVKEKPYPGGINPWWVEVDPSSVQKVYIGTDNAVYASEDGGQTWTVLTANRTAEGWQGNGLSGLVSRNVEWNPRNFNHLILQGMDAAKAIQSWDGGEHWRVDNPGLPNYSGGHDVAFAGNWVFGVFGQDGQTDELIARSSDAGRSWVLLQSPVSPSEAKQVHADPTNPDRLWIVVNQQLWYSENATQTTHPQWVQLFVGNRENPVGTIAALPDDGDRFYIATDAGIYQTTNGLDFELIGGVSGAERISLAVAPSAPHLLFAAKDQAYWDEDYGLWQYDAIAQRWSRLWDNRDIASRIGGLAVHPQDANILAVITNDLPYHDKTWATGVWISRDRGRTWQQENQGLPMLRGNTIAFHPQGNQLVVGLGGAGFYTTDFDFGNLVPLSESHSSLVLPNGPPWWKWQNALWRGFWSVSSPLKIC